VSAISNLSRSDLNRRSTKFGSLEVTLLPPVRAPRILHNPVGREPEADGGEAVHAIPDQDHPMVQRMPVADEGAGHPTDVRLQVIGVDANGQRAMLHQVGRNLQERRGGRLAKDSCLSVHRQLDSMRGCASSRCCIPSSLQSVGMLK
jgi:hypothetical protein